MNRWEKPRTLFDLFLRMMVRIDFSLWLCACDLSDTMSCVCLLLYSILREARVSLFKTRKDAFNSVKERKSWEIRKERLLSSPLSPSSSQPSMDSFILLILFLLSRKVHHCSHTNTSSSSHIPWICDFWSFFYTRVKRKPIKDKSELDALSHTGRHSTLSLCVLSFLLLKL